jgi:sugar/nucleoside kinase (ribokinase family)
MKARGVVVFGPAYLDRVLRVDRPLIGDGLGPPLDQSVDGEGKFGESPSIKVMDPGGFVLEITSPPDWPGPRGEVRLLHAIRAGLRGTSMVQGSAWQDDLGGMGAGYASSLRGLLHSALGPETDPTSRAITGLLARYGIDHRVSRIADHRADWTLLISSGEFGDKLAIGFRGCHAALDPVPFARDAAVPCDLRVVAGLPNRVAGPLLEAPGARTRFLAPAMRNMTDRDHPLGRFAACVDILSCNRSEWAALEGPDLVAERVAIVAVTDGSRGIDLRYTTPAGEVGNLHMPAFPRAHPPRDTNRAGEAFGSTLVSALLAGGWDGMTRVVSESLIRSAAARAAAAAALVLDRLDFGFPGPEEIDAALRVGRVA